MWEIFFKKRGYGIIIALLNGTCAAVRGETHTMDRDREAPWNGVERRKRVRRSDEVRKCFHCNAYFPARDILNLCPDCVRKMMMHYKQGNNLTIKL